MDDFIRFGKVLSDPTSVRIVALLKEKGELCICELESSLSISRPQADRSLHRLREINLVEVKRRGSWLAYSINARTTKLIGHVFSEYGESLSWDATFNRAQSRVDELLARRVDGWCPVVDFPD